MSRVAKAPVKFPSNVEVSITKEVLTVKGPKGTLSHSYNKLVQISHDSQTLTFSPAASAPNAWAQAGTLRAIANNMVQGVTQGFSRSLDLVGVGYRAQAAGDKLTLSLGYSHPIEYRLPSQVKVETPSATNIVLHGIDKQLLGQIASEIRAFRPPEPYKGKGVRYTGETIILKEAKKK